MNTVPAEAEGTRLLARSRSENFPVASRLLPRRVRRHLMALYGYARFVDWAGDEAPGDRLALLDAIEADLDRLLAGQPARLPLVAGLAPTLRACDLPREPLADLIEANRRDQTRHRYERFEELRGYCALSADPVGRLVLCVFGVATPERIAWSDAICSALQLAEHWQDVAEDARAGRIYLPGEDLRRFQVPETALLADSASPELRRLLRFEAERARRLLEQGSPLVASLRGRARLAVAGFVAGGHAALDALQRADFDPLPGAPRPRRRDLLRHALGVLRRRRGARGRTPGGEGSGPAARSLGLDDARREGAELEPLERLEGRS